jgi:hypothetical protein
MNKKITYTNEVLDFHHGQIDCEAGIYLNDKIIGFSRYVLYNHELTISYIIIKPEYRRQGYASRLLKYIKQKNLEYKYKSSLKTPEGAAFKPKDLSLTENIKAKFVYNFLFESFLNDINPENVITNRYVDLQLNNSFNIELWAYYYKEKYNIENVDDDDIIQLPEFKEWLKNLLYEQFNEIGAKLWLLIKDNGKIDLWRILKVDKNWFEHFQKEGKHLGIYWSFDKKAAKPHHGYNQKEKNIEILIKTSVKEEHVNWIDTYRLNLEPCSEEEKEIRLFKNTPLKIEELYINKKNVDISSIKNKIFKA